MKKEEDFVYFRSPKSGLFLSLGDAGRVVFQPVTPKKGSGEPYYGLLKISKTETAKIEAIMSHRSFGKTVFRMLTQKELEEKIRLEKAGEYLANLKRDIGLGIMPYPDLDSKKADEIYAFANAIGISIYGMVKGTEKKKTKAELISEIKANLSDLDSEPEEND